MSLEMNHVYYTYQEGSPAESHALQDICLNINEGEFLGIVGHTGSGKSTLIQHLNGLLKPSKGEVLIDDIDINRKDAKAQRKERRMRVGLVFQYPEYQLFEETVELDIGFGPRSMGLSEAEVTSRVQEAMALMQLDYNALRKQSPFDLSGGQKRKVAIAGVLAMKPKYLVLDEPTAGLVPMGREEFLELLGQLHQQGMTIIMVSHSMDDMARYAQRMIVMDHGKIQLEGTPREIFAQPVKLRELGLDVPTLTKLLLELKQRGLNVRTDLFEPQAVKAEIMRALKAGKEQVTC